MSWLLYKLVSICFEVRLTPEEEERGIDLVVHGEDAFPLKRLFPELMWKALDEEDEALLQRANKRRNSKMGTGGGVGGKKE